MHFFQWLFSPSLWQLDIVLRPHTPCCTSPSIYLLFLRPVCVYVCLVVRLCLACLSFTVIGCGFFAAKWWVCGLVLDAYQYSPVYARRTSITQAPFFQQTHSGDGILSAQTRSMFYLFHWLEIGKVSTILWNMLCGSERESEWKIMCNIFSKYRNLLSGWSRPKYSRCNENVVS